MKALKQLGQNLANLNPDKIFIALVDENDDFIISLNQDGQLFDLGIDSTGRLLSTIGGDYAASTVEKKKSEGLPFDRITLFDTGAFYDSFIVKARKDEFEIIANTLKDGNDLQDDWGNKILGLTDESIEELQGEFLQQLIDLIKEKAHQ